MLLEIVLVFLMVGLNGVLAMSELAIVSSRAGRLKLRAERGDRGASIALNLARDPGRFLSTVQIGITLVGVLAGAFSGATIGTRLASVLPLLGVPETMASEAGVGIVVIVITYLSLIIGELVPKRIAFASPERVACIVAPGMHYLSRIAAPIVWFLDRSGELVLRLLGQSDRRQTPVNDDDIRTLLSEAAGAGVIHRAEKELIGGVMRFSDRRARGLITPRHDVEIAEAGESRDKILARVIASGHSRLPLRTGGTDDITGVIHSRDLLAKGGTDFDPVSLMHAAPVIHESLPALDVIDRLRESPVHMLLVYDEYGHFKGIITPMDVLGTIAGGFDESEDEKPGFVTREDGSLLVDGAMPIDEFRDILGLELERQGKRETVAGLVLDRLREVPSAGQGINLKGWRIEIVDMDGRRIDKLIVKRDPMNNGD